MLTWVGNNSDPSFSRSLSNHAQTRWKLESNRTTLYLIIWDLCNWRWKPKLESPHLKWEMAFQSSFDLRQFRVLGRGGGWTHGQLQTQRLDLLDPQTCLSVTSYRIGFDNWKWSHLYPRNARSGLVEPRGKVPWAGPDKRADQTGGVEYRRELVKGGSLEEFRRIRKLDSASSSVDLTGTGSWSDEMQLQVEMRARRGQDPDINSKSKIFLPFTPIRSLWYVIDQSSSVQSSFDHRTCFLFSPYTHSIQSSVTFLSLSISQ